MKALTQKAAEISRHVEAGDRARADAMGHYAEAGRLLLQIRADNKRGFEAFLDKRLASVGRSRAYELMQLASGRKTVEEIKEATRKRVEKHRRKKEESVTARAVTDDDESEISREITRDEFRAAVLVRVQAVRDCADWIDQAVLKHPGFVRKEYALEAAAVLKKWIGTVRQLKKQAA